VSRLLSAYTEAVVRLSLAVERALEARGISLGGGH
jgi:hypothetical protein